MAAGARPRCVSSQECPLCHFVDRANRPTPENLGAWSVGVDQADREAAVTLAGRWQDREVSGFCRDKQEIKTLLMTRHEKSEEGKRARIKGAGPPVQLSYWDLPETFLDLSQA